MDPLIKIGTPAPNFQLYDLNGELHSLESMHGRIVVLDFWSAECDWCERIDRELVNYLLEWENQVKVWWIASNANEPPDLIARVAGERKLPTLLVDPDQAVADMYDAQMTPHFFVVDTVGKLAYQGAWDDITFRQRTATRLYVPQAIKAMTRGRVPEITQTPAYGCVLVRYRENPG